MSSIRRSRTRKSKELFTSGVGTSSKRFSEPNGAGQFAIAYGAQRDGNVENDPQGEFQHKNILFRAGDTTGFEKDRALLLAARGKRVRPHLDDKILTAWNAS